jgi:hypothetical protein
MYATLNFFVKENANVVTNDITSARIMSLSIIRVLKRRKLRMYAMVVPKRVVVALISITIVQLELSKNTKLS